MDYSILLITIATLLGVPFLTPFIAKYIYLQPAFVKNRVYCGAVLFIALVVICLYFSISFASLLCNALMLSVAYTCFGFLTFSLYAIKPKAIGVILGLLSTMPLVLGVLLSTISFLGLLFIIGDFKVDYEIHLPRGLKCQASLTGNATAAGGNDVRLYTQIIGVVERRVARKYYSDTSKEHYVSHQHACETLADAYRRTHR